jgi:hypothetical protein
LFIYPPLFPPFNPTKFPKTCIPISWILILFDGDLRSKWITSLTFWTPCCVILVLFHSSSLALFKVCYLALLVLCFRHGFHFLDIVSSMLGFSKTSSDSTELAQDSLFFFQNYCSPVILFSWFIYWLFCSLPVHITASISNYKTFWIF